MADNGSSCDGGKRDNQDRKKSIETDHETGEIGSPCASDESSSSQSVYWEDRSIEAEDREDREDRIYRSRILPPVPVFDVPLGEDGEVLAFDWLYYSTKQKFDKEHAKLLAQCGGVSRQHNGSCVFAPPTLQSDSLTFRGANYSTSFVRALAWFHDQSWFRSGTELDIFLGCGPYQPMEASHLCHHSRCLVHVVYQTTSNIEDRKICSQSARDLRRQGLDISGRCTQHDPPCLLQHAALTSVEAYSIQLAIRSRASGLEPGHFPDRPASHPYSTFETQLPLCWKVSEPAISVDPSHLVHELSDSFSAKTPELLCKFCSEPNRFAVVLELWGHIYHKHQEFDVQKRLDEIKQTASIWRGYWDHLVQCKKGSTIDKLVQARLDNFCWEDVIAWDLR